MLIDNDEAASRVHKYCVAPLHRQLFDHVMNAFRWNVSKFSSVSRCIHAADSINDGGERAGAEWMNVGLVKRLTGLRTVVAYVAPGYTVTQPNDRRDGIGLPYSSAKIRLL